MSNIVVNAPIQNKDFCPDIATGKVIPLFAADWLIHTDREYAGQQPVDLWNSVLASEQAGYDGGSYAALSAGRLRAKYESTVLKDVRTPVADRQIYTDTNENFHAWTVPILDKALDSGDLKTVGVGMHVCNNCDTAISVAEGPKPRGCAHCGTTSGACHHEERPMLVTTIDAGVHAKVSSITGSPGQRTDTRLSIVNRRRLGGIDLEQAGFPGQVLDPRIGLGLLALYAAGTQGAGKVDMVVSRASAAHNLPQLFAAIRSQDDELPQLGLKQIAKAPVRHMAHLRQEGLLSSERYARVLQHILPPILLSMHQDMTPAHLEQVVFSKKQIYS